MASAPAWRTGLALFALSASLYLGTASGTLPSIDIQQGLEVATSVVRDATFEVAGPAAPGGGAVLGEDGRRYAAHNPGLALLLVPVGSLAGPTTPVAALHGVASLVVPLVSAAGVVAFWAVQRRLCAAVGARAAPGGAGAPVAVVATLVYAVATAVWTYAHDGFDVGPTNAAVLGALAALLAADDTETDTRRRRRWLALSGVSLAAAVMLRIDAALLAPAFGLGALAVSRHHARCTRRWTTVLIDGAAWVTPVLVALALTGWYNLARFGSPFDTGHAGDPNVAFTGGVAAGLVGWVASPGKAVLLFSPPVAVAVVGWRRLAAHRPLVVAVTAGAVLPWLVFHAGLGNWGGDEAFGPRFVVPVLGLLLLALGPALEVVARRRVAMALAGVVVAAGVAVQLVGVAVSAIPAARASASGYDPWAVSDSALVTSAEALARAVRGQAPYARTPLGDPPPRLDVWWLRDDPLLDGPAGAALLVVIVAAGVTGAAGVVDALRRPDPGPGPAAGWFPMRTGCHRCSPGGNDDTQLPMRPELPTGGRPRAPVRRRRGRRRRRAGRR